MPTPPLSEKSRKLFNIANKYQQNIILVSLITSALIFSAFIGVVIISDPYIFKQATVAQIALLRTYVVWGLIFAMAAMLMAALMVAFIISHHLVGAFGRIIRELDEVIEGKRVKTITARPYDELANNILKRVNVLVRYYVENNHAGSGRK